MKPEATSDFPKLKPEQRSIEPPKVYKQKGTGGARHGSGALNHVGGGVAHGPKIEKEQSDYQGFRP